MRVYAAAVLLLIASIGLAGQTKPQTEIERLRQLQAIEEAKKALKEIEALENTITETKRLKCMMAVGSAPFCNCLTDETPFGASFDNYIAITTKSKEELGYASLDSEWKVVVDKTLIARDACVAKVFRASRTPK